MPFCCLGSVMAVPHIYHGSKRHEYVVESFNAMAPIDHRAGHRSPFILPLTVDEKLKAGIIKKRYAGCRFPHVEFPMASICRHRHQRQDFRAVLQMRPGTLFQPVFDGRPAFSISSIRWIYEYRLIVPRNGQPVRLWKLKFHLCPNNGILAGARIKSDGSRKELSHCVNVLRRRAPMIAQRLRVISACCHATICLHWICQPVSEGSRAVLRYCFCPVK